MRRHVGSTGSPAKVLILTADSDRLVTQLLDAGVHGCVTQTPGRTLVDAIRAVLQISSSPSVFILSRFAVRAAAYREWASHPRSAKYCSCSPGVNKRSVRCSG